MPKFYNNVDLNKNEIQNAKIQNLAADPGTPVAGQIYYNTTNTTLEFYNGTGFITLGRLDQIEAPTAAVSLNSQKITNLADPTVGTDAATRGYVLGLKVTDLTAPTSAFSMNTQKITNLAEPTADSDAATKGYVDATAQGLDVKDSVDVATTANIVSLSAGPLSIDGVTLAVDDRVLVKDQSTASENGIYRVSAVGGVSTTLVRASDADTSDEVTAGMFTFVTEGTAAADTGWVLTTNDPITLGTTALAFTQFTGAGTITAGAGLTKSGNTLDVVGTANRITANADSIDIASTYVGQTSITTLGTIATGTWSATTIAANRGGTGHSTYAVGDILYASTTTALSKLAAAATGNALISGGAGVAPSWGKIGLTTHVSGTLAVGNGGTGATTFTANGVLLGNTASAISATAAGTANQVLRVPGAGGAPAFGAVDLTSSAAVTGALPIANGGTGSTTAAAAAKALTVPQSITGTIGDGAATSFNIATTFDAQTLTVSVYQVASTFDQIYPDVRRSADTGINATVTIVFAIAPTANQFRYVIHGVPS